ncbi:MAG: hypothetical protein HC899_38455 [Leptolyngbyaceae cyanobacterium SM1_4_3]|nr:hypothetical protein [Leptolyngbyaceae cyanobacterium SM1_4_3]
MIPIIVGEPYKAVKLSRSLLNRGITVQPMVYPSVPYNAARLRFFVTCLHTEAPNSADRCVYSSGTESASLDELMREQEVR